MKSLRMHQARWCTPAIKAPKKAELAKMEEQEGLENESDQVMENEAAKNERKKASAKENSELKCEKCGLYTKSKSGLSSHLRAHLLKEEKGNEIEQSKEENKPKDGFVENVFSNAKKSAD